MSITSLVADSVREPPAPDWNGPWASRYAARMPAVSKRDMIVWTDWESPLGRVVLAASATGLCGVWFAGQKHAPSTAAWPRDDQHPLLRRTIDELNEFFAGQRRLFELPLDLGAGTAFQRSVWRILQRIPAGRTLAYAEIARRVGRPQAVRAAAAAIGRNPLSIVVPCHRVLGRDGSLTGYAGGLERKAALLALEGAKHTN